MVLTDKQRQDLYVHSLRRNVVCMPSALRARATGNGGSVNEMFLPEKGASF